MDIFFLFQSFKAEDAQYADMKKDLRVQIRDMRRTVRHLLLKKTLYL
jgi:hypothetical protein